MTTDPQWVTEIDWNIPGTPNSVSGSDYAMSPDGRYLIMVIEASNADLSTIKDVISVWDLIYSNTGATLCFRYDIPRQYAGGINSPMYYEYDWSDDFKTIYVSWYTEDTSGGHPYTYVYNFIIFNVNYDTDNPSATTSTSDVNILTRVESTVPSTVPSMRLSSDGKWAFWSIYPEDPSIGGEKDSLRNLSDPNWFTTPVWEINHGTIAAGCYSDWNAQSDAFYQDIPPTATATRIFNCATYSGTNTTEQVYRVLFIADGTAVFTPKTALNLTSSIIAGAQLTGYPRDFYAAPAGDRVVMICRNAADDYGIRLICFSAVDGSIIGCSEDISATYSDSSAYNIYITNTNNAVLSGWSTRGTWVFDISDGQPNWSSGPCTGLMQLQTIATQPLTWSAGSNTNLVAEQAGNYYMIEEDDAAPATLSSWFQLAANSQCTSSISASGTTEVVYACNYGVGGPVSIVSLNASTGATVWSGGVGENIEYPPAVMETSHSVVYIDNVSITPYLRCRDTSGTLLWSTLIGTYSGGVGCYGPVVDPSGNIYVTAGAGEVGSELIHKFNSSGTLLWRSTITGFQSFPAVDGNSNVFAVNSDGKVYCLSQANGVMLWSTSVSGIDHSPITISQDRSTIYIPVAGGIQALSATTGGNVWRTTPVGATYTPNHTAVASNAAGTQLHAYLSKSGSASQLVAISSSGVSAWTVSTEAANSSSTPLVDASGNVYVYVNTSTRIKKYNSSGVLQWTSASSALNYAATPMAINAAGTYVYFSYWGQTLICANAATGAFVWGRDLLSDFGFQYSSGVSQDYY